MTTTTAKRPSILRLLALIRPKEKKYLAGLILRTALTTTERVTVAFLIKRVIDSVTTTDMANFQSGLVAWVLFYAGYVLVSPFIYYLWRSVIYEVTANIREVVFRHLNRLPLGYHELHHSGDALSILTNDVSTAERAYQDDMLMLVEASAQGLGAVIAMMLLNWQLALLVLLSGVAPLVVNSLFARPLRKIGQELQANLGQLSERMTDLLSGFNVVRTFNLGAWILSRFEQSNDMVLNTSLRRVRTESALASANAFAGIFNFASLVVGSYFVLTGWTTFGVMIALIQLSNNINYFVYTIGGTISRVQGALAAADRILTLLDTPLEPESYDGRTSDDGRPSSDVRLPTNGRQPARQAHAATQAAAPIAPTAAGLQFQDVQFAYQGSENILNGLSFAVEPGQMVAFAGPSGGGKSTIFKLLLGCYQAGSGAIHLAGQPVNSLRLEDLRRQFAYVPQDPYLFFGTIAENIRYGNLDASEEQVITAAKAAFAHDFISALPEGYQTLAGERGVRLSGGQRQRIAIARALLKDAPILLLDEATSALDSESEQLVQQALEVLMRGRTTLVIAHRFSTILNADKIYVIEAGRVVEHGSHETLLAQRGVYHKLYEMQFKQETDMPQSQRI